MLAGPAIPLSLPGGRYLLQDLPDRGSPKKPRGNAAAKTAFLAITLAQCKMHLGVDEGRNRNAPRGVELPRGLKRTRQANGFNLLQPIGPRPAGGGVPACFDVPKARPPDGRTVGNDFPRQVRKFFTHRSGTVASHIPAAKCLLDRPISRTTPRSANYLSDINIHIQGSSPGFHVDFTLLKHSAAVSRRQRQRSK